MDAVETDNIANAAGRNLDYAGGKVPLFGEPYATSIAAEPADREQAGTINIRLAGKNATRFRATLGGDYPVGGDEIHRKIVATRSTGNEARFLSVVELHEDHPVIKSISTPNRNTLVVELVDGRSETIEISGLDGDGTTVNVAMTVRQDGNRVRSETTKPQH